MTEFWLKTQAFLNREGPALLKATLGLVFVWFGVLKLIGRTPVREAIAASTPFDPAWFIPVLGVWEVVIGAGLLLEKWPKMTLVLFVAQMLGTFSVLVLRPDIAFQGFNPFLLTTEGEFVVKNLVLLAAGLAAAGTMLEEPPRV